MNKTKSTAIGRRLKVTPGTKILMGGDIISGPHKDTADAEQFAILVANALVRAANQPPTTVYLLPDTHIADFLD